jgi:hypothetical protein
VNLDFDIKNKKQDNNATISPTTLGVMWTPVVAAGAPWWVAVPAAAGIFGALLGYDKMRQGGKYPRLT